MDKTNYEKSNWEKALNLQKIDGYKPNDSFSKLIKEQINGKITTDDMVKKIVKKYKQ